MDHTREYYSKPSYVGGGFPVYSGSRRQLGGSIFGSSVRQSAVPVGKSIGKAVGKRLMGYVADVATDISEGRNAGEAIKSRAKQHIANAAASGLQTLTDVAGNVLSSHLSSPSATTRKRAAPQHHVSQPPIKRARPHRQQVAAQRRAPPRRAALRQGRMPMRQRRVPTRRPIAVRRPMSVRRPIAARRPMPVRRSMPARRPNVTRQRPRMAYARPFSRYRPGKRLF